MLWQVCPHKDVEPTGHHRGHAGLFYLQLVLYFGKLECLIPVIS